MLDFPNSPTVGQIFVGPFGTFKWDGTKWAPSAVVGTPIPTDIGRNKLHNALFNVQQRGAGPWTAVGFTLDRWKISMSLDTFSASSQLHNDTTRAQIGDEEATNYFFAQVTGNAGASAFSLVQQKIEGVRRLTGKTVTVSFWAAGTVGSKIGVGLVQQFGTGGSPSADVGIAGQAVIIAASWTRYSLTFSIPSVSGKTLGTNGDDNTTLQFWFSAGTTYAGSSGGIGVQTVNNSIWGVQLEIGSQATPLEKIDPQIDVANCKRFYQTGGPWFYAYGTAGSSIGCTYPLSVSMRTVPSVALIGQSYTNASGLTASVSTPNSIIFYASITATGNAQFSSSFTASADL